MSTFLEPARTLRRSTFRGNIKVQSLGQSILEAGNGKYFCFKGTRFTVYEVKDQSLDAKTSRSIRPAMSRPFR